MTTVVMCQVVVHGCRRKFSRESARPLIEYFPRRFLERLTTPELRAATLSRKRDALRMRVVCLRASSASHGEPAQHLQASTLNLFRYRR